MNFIKIQTLTFWPTRKPHFRDHGMEISLESTGIMKLIR